ncbi:MAG: M20/M25/M40 family metallo-hydrolase [Deltaproteobacteria bacterium]|nr:M20/M25/M40 family metallo-hydrolase [Deltaproteobacteria bacterium]
MHDLAGLTPDRWKDACGEASALLQEILRLDTTNPPGNERLVANALAASLARDGVQCEILEAAPGRANLVCRLSSGREEPALLLTGHADVVSPGDLSRWTHPPFAGVLADGMIWGRGAVDMKNMVAMSTMVVKLLARQGVTLKRDVVLAIVADEEEGCDCGARFLVERHADKVRAGYALGEIGGFPTPAGTARIIPVQTAEKGMCWLRLRAEGPTGHGSMPRPDNAVLRLCDAVARLGEKPLPQHNTPVVQNFIEQVAALQKLPGRLVMPQMLNPRLSNVILSRLLPDKEQGRIFGALLHNTVSPTVLRAGEKANMIPGEAEATLDGRILPGQTAEDLLHEIREVVGSGFRLEVIRTSPPVINHPPDSSLWDCIRQTIARHAGGLPAVPAMIPGFTDAQYFSRLGIRWYGFSPLWLEASSGLRFADLFHGYDERIPEDGYHWGLRALFETVHAFCAGAA